MLLTPRYEARQHGSKWGVFDTFAQEWAWHAASIARFIDLDKPTALAQSAALNRIYEMAL